MANPHELLENFLLPPASFLDPPSSLKDDCLSLLAKLFEWTVASRSPKCPSLPLSQLYCEGFGPDELWEELELLNEPLTRYLQHCVTELGKGKFKLLNEYVKKVEDDKEEAVSECDDEDEDDIEMNTEDAIEEEESAGSISEEQAGDKIDNFFNVDEMEEFVNQADASDGEQEEYDLFRSVACEAQQPLYGDFFDPPPPSTHQKKEERMKRHIARLEATNLADKSWQMSGETSAKGRPENSLLEEDLMYETGSRPAPEITEQDTRTLEDIIKQRICDKTWDDVERRIKPPEKPYNYSLSRPLDQEKSKLSLSEVYEQEYLQQSAGKVKEEDTPQHCEIKLLMERLFTRLDALSNYHFTPKIPDPEIKTVANMPSLSLEEVTPAAHSEVTLLAPEEIQARSTHPETSGSEKTVTDKKRERRKKKRRQHNIRKLQQLKHRGLLRTIKSKSSQRQQFSGDLSTAAVKSSTQFFSQLQEQVNSKLKQQKRAPTTSSRHTHSHKL